MTTPQADPWSVPSEIKSGDRVAMDDLTGELLLFTPKKYEDDIPSNFPNKPNYDRVIADIAVIGKSHDTESEAFTLDPCEPADSVEFPDVWVTQGRLIGKTKGKVGQGMVLGRLIKVPPTTKGMNPSFDLDDPTPEDQVAARAYYDAKLSPPF